MSGLADSGFRLDCLFSLAVTAVHRVLSERCVQPTSPHLAHETLSDAQLFFWFTGFRPHNPVLSVTGTVDPSKTILNHVSRRHG